MSVNGVKTFTAVAPKVKNLKVFGRFKTQTAIVGKGL